MYVYMYGYMYAYIYLTCSSHISCLQLLTHVAPQNFVNFLNGMIKIELNSLCSKRNWAVSWGTERGSGKKNGMKEGDTKQFFPTEFQTTSQMLCTFNRHLPRSANGFPNAWLKRTRNITKLRHIVKSVQTKLYKRDDYTGNRSWSRSAETPLQNGSEQSWLESVHTFRWRTSSMS